MFVKVIKRGLLSAALAVILLCNAAAAPASDVQNQADDFGSHLDRPF